MKNYELLCVLPGTMTEEEVEPVVKKVEEVILEGSGENLKIENMGKNRLAYPMNHIRYGYFRLFLFESEKDNIKKIREKLGLMPELLRALFSVYDPKKRKQSKINYVTDQSGFVTMTKDIKIKEARERGVQPTTVEARVLPRDEKSDGKKVDLKEIDEQLDKILESDIASV